MKTIIMTMILLITISTAVFGQTAIQRYLDELRAEREAAALAREWQETKEQYLPILIFVGVFALAGHFAVALVLDACAKSILPVNSGGGHGAWWLFYLFFGPLALTCFALFWAREMIHLTRQAERTNTTVSSEIGKLVDGTNTLAGEIAADRLSTASERNDGVASSDKDDYDLDEIRRKAAAEHEKRQAAVEAYRRDKAR